MEYDNGYYLLDAPFNTSEIKIIIDSINSLKNLDTRLLNRLNEKLYSYISDDDVRLLENIKHISKHQDSKLLEHMEDVIESIRNNSSITIITKESSKSVEIFPVFLHRENDYYYFYYHYPKSNKLYHYRFDNIKNIRLNNITDDINISYKKIVDTIEESSRAYTKGETSLINIKLLNNDNRLVSRFIDDFPTAIRTKDGFSIKTNINDIFFSKLTSFSNEIKIIDKTISKQYIKYLNSIINTYK